MFHFSSEIIFGQLLLTFGNFLLVTLQGTDKLKKYFGPKTKRYGAKMTFGAPKRNANRQVPV